MRNNEITEDQIKKLRNEAWDRMDWAQVKICDAAIRGSRMARAHCVRAIHCADAEEVY